MLTTIYHGGRGGGGGVSLSKHALLICHCTQVMDNRFVTAQCSMSMVSKALCSHFSGQGTYYATHTLGLIKQTSQ